ncbi:site-specific integrase [Xanthomonas euvesicatoria]|uniref:site-specific integrase n=1 Tax=Xanthomonas euvesicatoria TaxID=456327 RepID=UPI000AFDB2F4|nr:site-specific integrase [Xanthomonas euvesicatoria]
MTPKQNQPPVVPLINDGEHLHFKSIQVGKTLFNDVTVRGRQAAIQLSEMLQSAWQTFCASRARRPRSRYPEALPTGSPARLLSVEIADYLKDMARRDLQDTTINSAARSLKILRLTCGDVPVSQIDHQHIHQMWDVLRWAPPGLTSNPRFESMSAEDIIGEGAALNVPCPASATTELHRRMVTSFFNALLKTKAVAHSPMAAFKPKKPSLLTNTTTPSRLLSSSDIQKIFDPATFNAWASKFPHRWWGPILGLYTGARINEVAQLKVADIILEHGQWCMAIRMTADDDLAQSNGAQTRQRLKGKSAIRKIPLHPEVINAGFLDFVADIKACGHPRLFPHLSAGKNKKSGASNCRYSQGLLNQFSDYLKDLGFAKGIGFHGFRHTLATELHAAGITPQDIALLTGHSLVKSVPVLQDHYIHKSSGNVMQRQLAALLLYQPIVQLPVYQQGQFKEKLRKGAKMYP